MTADTNVDDEVDAFLDKIAREYKDGWTEENWEEEMEKHPFFMTKMPETEEDMSPAIEALRQMKWEDDETPMEIAHKYKDEGNIMFKAKKYKNAVASYTMGLKQKIDDRTVPENREMMSVLYSNRAAAHYYLQNYRSALNDCIFAFKMNRANLKAIVKAAECASELKQFDDAIRWCDIGLKMQPDSQKAKELRLKYETEKKVAAKEARKKEMLERKKAEHQAKIANLIKANNIRIEEQKDQDKYEELLNSMKLSEDGSHLVWPVVLLYPEYSQSDLIEAFNEQTTFEDHLKVVFGEPAGWDEERKYRPDTIEIYYENFDKQKLMKLKKTSTLLDAIRKDGYKIQHGSPQFILLAKGSEFEAKFIKNFEK